MYTCQRLSVCPNRFYNCLTTLSYHIIYIQGDEKTDSHEHVKKNSYGRINQEKEYQRSSGSLKSPDTHEAAIIYYIHDDSFYAERLSLLKMTMRMPVSLSIS
nr:PREDICTED: uncharacterized protein LOC105663291 [Megachile rotundata]